MKQLLFLLLFPCLAMAQYPGNAGQKITLGEQTSADGLVYRGLAADTTRKPSVDTMAYILLDTNTNIIWQYKKAVNNAWTRVGGSISSGLTGVLPVANGGTNTSTLNANKVMVGNGTSGVLTPTNLHWDNTNSRLGIGTTSPTATLHLSATSPYFHFDDIASAGTKKRTYFFAGDIGTDQTLIYGFANLNGTSAADVFSINELGRFGIGTNAPTEKLHVVGNARITAVGAGAYSNDLNITSTGVLTTASSSDETFKYNINPITYGLSTILQLKPVSFQWKKGDEHDLGFIAQDAVNIIPEAVDTFWDSSLLFRSNTIIPILTKAIQEQQILIKALEQRILILENK